MATPSDRTPRRKALPKARKAAADSAQLAAEIRAARPRPGGHKGRKTAAKSFVAAAQKRAPADPLLAALRQSRLGKPLKLDLSPGALTLIRRLGELHATSKECAGFFSVSEPAWLRFKADHPEADAAFVDGMAEGKISLRRLQLRMAHAGNTAMAIFLGKNLLGQSDRVEHSGEVNMPVRFIVERTAVSDGKLLPAPPPDDE